MKRYVLTIILLALALSLGSAPNQVTIHLTTSVPEVLIHGFLKDGDTTQIYASTSESDAFNPNGVQLTYAVKTNTAIPMTVYATVAPFTRSDSGDPGEVGISDIIVKDANGAESNSAFDQLEGNKREYHLASFTPNKGGMAVYAYTLTVIANQNDVESAPSGNYSTTVSIGITTGN